MSTTTKGNTRRFSVNAKGRDFVVGDLHGAFDLLDVELRQVRFDPTQDRLFCLGDLINRGGNSGAVADFLSRPGIYALQGNHEWLVLHAACNLDQDSPEFETLMRTYSAQWFVDLPQAQRNRVVLALSELPYVIEIEQPDREPIGLVHADMPTGMPWDDFFKAIDSGEEQALLCALWSRARFQDGNTETIAGASLVYFGHNTRFGMPTQLGNTFHIDTGAIYAETYRALESINSRVGNMPLQVAYAYRTRDRSGSPASNARLTLMDAQKGIVVSRAKPTPRSPTVNLFPDHSGATFSSCAQYRYLLWRTWEPGARTILFLMLNPSTADAVANDPTVERCQRRAIAMGFGRMMVANIFALRSTDPQALYAHPEPIGPENNEAILEAAQQADLVVCAWGTHGAHQARGLAVLRMLRDAGVEITCLGVNKDGSPKHPLYVAYRASPVAMPITESTMPAERAA